MGEEETKEEEGWGRQSREQREAWSFGKFMSRCLFLPAAPAVFLMREGPLSDEELQPAQPWEAAPTIFRTSLACTQALR